MVFALIFEGDVDEEDEEPEPGPLSFALEYPGNLILRSNKLKTGSVDT